MGLEAQMGQVGFTTVLIACIKPLFEPKSASLPNIASVVVNMVKFLKNPLPLCQLVMYLAKEGGGGHTGGAGGDADVDAEAGGLVKFCTNVWTGGDQLIEPKNNFFTKVETNPTVLARDAVFSSTQQNDLRPVLELLKARPVPFPTQVSERPPHHIHDHF